MAGILNTIYAIIAIAVAVMGLLFVTFGTGDRDAGLFVGGAIGTVLLLGLGVTLLL
jgi:hypothetical protein